MDFLYQDDRVIVCLKPAGVLSTDEPGGVPELVRNALGDPNANIRTVHRLDRVVSGVMVLARTARAASDLSSQIRDGSFQKTYLAVCHGTTPERAVWRDLLFRDPVSRMTQVVDPSVSGAQPAALEFEKLASRGEHSLVRIRLLTGRTHQIRVQFASRGFPLAGDRRYGTADGWNAIGLWSHRLCFLHPRTSEPVCCTALPPLEGPWAMFGDELSAMEDDCNYDANRI